jgi:hypothetical protein
LPLDQRDVGALGKGKERLSPPVSLRYARFLNLAASCSEDRTSSPTSEPTAVNRQPLSMKWRASFSSPVSLIIGQLANTIGYEPLFVCLSVFDIAAFLIVLVVLGEWGKRVADPRRVVSAE